MWPKAWPVKKKNPFSVYFYEILSLEKEKYKYHYFELDFSNVSFASKKYGNIQYYVKSGNERLNKQKILSNIDYSAVCIERNYFKYKINDNVLLIIEKDNNTHVSEYFEILNIDETDAIDEICSFVENKKNAYIKSVF